VQGVVAGFGALIHDGAVKGRTLVKYGGATQNVAATAVATTQLQL
jgi:hypothetical protein